MDWIIWVIVIVVIVGVVWWLLNRNSSGNTTGTSMPSDAGASVPPSGQAGTSRPVAGAPAGGSAAPSADAAATAGLPGAAGFSPDAKAAPMPSTPAASAPAGGDVDDWDEDSAATTAAPASGKATGSDKTAVADEAEVPDKAEWEAQWSEAASTPHAADAHAEPHTLEAPAKESAGESLAAGKATAAPVHHPEYTEPHAPTLPGAESAAAEDVPDTAAQEKDVQGPGAGAELPPAGETGPAVASDTRAPSEAEAETLQAAASSAATEGSATHTAEPVGHLAADKPYGEGSAAPGPDGSAPQGYTVKGNAQTMIYHDETSPAYEETVAEVWFESAAHAEAAGFRAPRRSRH